MIDIKNISCAQQIKAARMLLAWDQVELASRASVGVATLRRIEAHHGEALGSPRSVAKIVSALELAGIEFLGTSENKLGVCLNLTKATYKSRS